MALAIYMFNEYYKKCKKKKYRLKSACRIEKACFGVLELTYEKDTLTECFVPAQSTINGDFEDTI